MDSYTCIGKSVGAIIRNKAGEILMIDRVHEPFGWACPAGHVEEDKGFKEPFRGSLDMEVSEEVGLKVLSAEMVLEETVSWNNCRRSTEGHHWRVYEVLEVGEYEEISINNAGYIEARGYGWFKPEELEHLELEPVWRYFLEKLGYIGEPKGGMHLKKVS